MSTFIHCFRQPSLHYGWLKEQVDEISSSKRTTFQIPENSAVLADFYSDPEARARGFFQDVLRQMLADARESGEIRQVYIFVSEVINFFDMS